MPGRYAVVIGINYDTFPKGTSKEVQARAGLNALSYAEADAQDLTRVLKADGYDVLELVGPAATREAIMKGLRDQRLKAGQDGLLFIHYSGHGALERDNDLAYLLPVDVDPEFLADKGIALNELAGNYLGKVGSAVVLLDCCHSGYSVGYKGNDQERYQDKEAETFRNLTTQSFQNVRNRVTIAACSGNQLAREDAELEHGVLTYYTLQHWKSSTERVDPESLFSYLSDEMPTRNVPAPVRGGSSQGVIELRPARPKPGEPDHADTPLTRLSVQERTALFALLQSIVQTDRELRDLAWAFDPRLRLRGSDLESKMQRLIGRAEESGRIDELRALANKLRLERQTTRQPQRVEASTESETQTLTRSRRGPVPARLLVLIMVVLFGGMASAVAVMNLDWPEQVTPTTTPEPHVTFASVIATPSPSEASSTPATTSENTPDTEPTLAPTLSLSDFPEPTFGAPKFRQLWERTDKLVNNGMVSRTWFWGDSSPGHIKRDEQYIEARPASVRLVQYFDKSRMELTYRRPEPSETPELTSNLYTDELMSGFYQVGDRDRMPSYPACIPMTGDADDKQAPTYSALQEVAKTRSDDHTGKMVTETISRVGEVTTDESKGSEYRVEFVHYEPSVEHNIPDVFWDFLNSSGAVYDRNLDRSVEEPLISPWWGAASGLPLSEPYWARAKIRGVDRDVLIQAFEKRVLTYVPDNTPGWQVEMGNVGQHYFDWRYRGRGRCSAKSDALLSPLELTLWVRP